MDYANALKKCGELKKQLAATYVDNDELLAAKNNEIAEIKKQLFNSNKLANDLQNSLDKSRESLKTLEDEIAASKKACCNIS